MGLTVRANVEKPPPRLRVPEPDVRTAAHQQRAIRRPRQRVYVIGMAGRGHSEKIVFDMDDPIGNSTCVACGECVQACPTGALMPATLVDSATGVFAGGYDREVESVCTTERLICLVPSVYSPWL